MKLEDVFEQTHRLPSVPKVVQELITSFGKPDTVISDIAERIAMDQVLAAKTLRLANSAHIASSHRISSLNEAAMLLGFSTLRTLVIATGISGAFVTTPGFDRRQFWQNSLDIAACARWLAQQIHADADAAFACGLLHNIGELLIHVVAPELAFHIDQSVAKGADRKTIENNSIGFDYIEVGAELARRWSFPETIHLAIRYQNEPLRHPECAPLGAILHLAIQLCRLQAAQSPLRADDLPAAVLTALNLDGPIVIAGLTQTRAARHEMDMLLNA